jgi:hypothetical protein
MIRVWGNKGKGDWNEYWRLDRILRAQPELEAGLAALGIIQDVYICPSSSKPPLDPKALLDIEVLIPPGEPLESDDPRIAELFKHVANVWAGPSPAADETEFESLVRQRLLYPRQRFELWDGQLPRFILGLDFDQGLRNFKLRPAEPERWRMVDHDVDGVNDDRRVLPAILLDPTEKGQALLDDLVKTFDYWHPGAGHNYRMPLNDVLNYRKVLLRHGLDCNESFRDGLVEGWYPIDIGERLSSVTIRTMCSTPLPDHLADLLAGEVDGGTGRDYIYFQFAALTDN